MAEISTKATLKKTKKPRARMLTQGFFLILVLLISIKKLMEEKGILVPLLPEASLHAICPFGGVVSLYQFFSTGTFIQKIHESSFVLMAAAFILAILAGPLICGWVCPFGTFQEIIGKLGRKISGKRYNHIIPEKTDRILRFIRYGVLALVVYNTAVAGKLLFQNVDPYYALFNLWSDELAFPALALLVATVILSLAVERPWCKYACPYGALLGLTNYFRIFKIRRVQETCIHCGACDRACPMNIKVSATETVKDHQCISCLACTSEFHCPVPETVELRTKGGGRR